MPKSAYASYVYLVTVLGAQGWAQYTPFVALFTSMPTAVDQTDWVELDENGGIGYTRIAVTWSGAGGGAGFSAEAHSDEAVSATATGDWVDILGYGIFDSSSGGNLIYYQTFASSITVPTGQKLLFQAGDLNITES